MIRLPRLKRLTASWSWGLACAVVFAGPPGCSQARPASHAYVFEGSTGGVSVAGLVYATTRDEAMAEMNAGGWFVDTLEEAPQYDPPKGTFRREISGIPRDRG